jgi:hypothetical protein
LNLFEAWDFQAARKYQASILRVNTHEQLPVNEQLLKLETRFEHLVFERTFPHTERTKSDIPRAMLNAQEEARQLLHSNPLVATLCGATLEAHHSTSAREMGRDQTRTAIRALVFTDSVRTRTEAGRNQDGD